MSIQVSFQLQIKLLLEKTREIIQLLQFVVLTNIEYRDRITLFQQYRWLVAKFSFDSFSYKIFSQFQYVYSYNLDATHHRYINQKTILILLEFLSFVALIISRYSVNV